MDLDKLWSKKIWTENQSVKMCDAKTAFFHLVWTPTVYVCKCWNCNWFSVQCKFINFKHLIREEFLMGKFLLCAVLSLGKHSHIVCSLWIFQNWSPFRQRWDTFLCSYFSLIGYAMGALWPVCPFLHQHFTSVILSRQDWLSL